MNIKRVVLLTVVCLVAANPSTMLWASLERGVIRGTVTDQQGAVVPNANVTIKNVDTNVEIHATTNSAGFFLAPELVPGNYSVNVEVSGFVPMDVNKVMVKANQVSTVDVQVVLGKTTQRVEVTASIQHVDTTAANFSTPVQERYMAQLPIEGRDLQNMVNLIPGVTPSGGPPGTSVALNGGQFGKFPDPSHTLGSKVAVNGSQAGSNVWYLDGSLNAAQGVDNVVVSPVPDAVAEFQAITDGFAAEYGRTAGAVFSTVLKSGTNNVHGDLYEYNRNSYFESRNPFAATDPFGHAFPPNFANWNQFGGTIGGPVYLPHVYNGKNRTFFFGAWDISLLHEANHASLYTVPTPLERQGNFSEFPNIRQYGIYDPMTTTYDAAIGQFVRQPFLNPDGSLATSLPANRLNSVAQFLVNTYPAPNFLDPRQQNAAAGGCLNRCNNYEGSYSSSQTSHNMLLKVDHQINAKNRMFAEWLYHPTYYRFLTLPWNTISAPLNGFNTGYPFDLKNQVATLGDTWTFSPTLVNEFRFSFSRQTTYPRPVPSSLQDIGPYLQQFPELSSLNFPPLNPTPIYNVGGLGAFGSPQQFVWDAVTQGETLEDDLAKVHGRHTIKTGFMFRVDQTGNVRPYMAYLTFGGSLTANPLTGSGGSGVAQFMLGALSQSTPTSPTSFMFFQPSTYASTHDWGFYVQDDYRLRPNLTVNIGLRYDIYGWYRARHANASVLNPTRPNPQDPVRLGTIDYVSTPRHPDLTPFPAHKTDFAPRLNFSYSPGADKKTVIRGGVDYVYTNGLTSLLGQASGASANPGFIQFSSFLSDATGQGLIGSGVVPAYILGNGAVPAPSTPVNPRQTDFQSLGPGNVQIIAFHNLPRDPNVLFWNLQVQRQLPGDMVVTVGYVGSKGTHLVGGNSVTNPVPDRKVLQYKSTLNSYVPMPADLAGSFGQTYFQSQLEKIYPQWPNITCEATCGVGGATAYHGFLLGVEKRFSQGFQFKAAYTFQKTLASAGLNEQFSNVEVASGGRGRNSQLAYNVYQIQNWDNNNADRSLASDNIPNIFNIALTYELPFGPGKHLASSAHGIARLLVEGWRIGINYNAESGVPLFISSPCNSLMQLNALRGGNCRPDLIGDPRAGRSGKSRYQLEHGWFNANAFSAPFGSDPTAIQLATTGTPAQKDAYQVNGKYPFYSYGTAGLRIPSAQSPGFSDMDAALSKDFKVSEAKYFQLRVESYNALNHQSLGLPNTNWCLPPNADGSVDAVHQAGCQFGWIGGVQRDPRAFEFSLKFVF